MGKKTVLFLIVALVALAVTPAVASADLVNEYGMHFAGQTKCLECHDAANAATVHGRMARTGIFPDAPAEWTMFRAAGDPEQVAGSGNTLWAAGGEYAIDQPWITLGDNTVGLATEYLFWKGSTDPTIMPWNLVEGLLYEHDEWMIGEDAAGLYDVTYACQRCHQLGTTNKAAAGETIPNPAATIQPGPTTAVQWARDASLGAPGDPAAVDAFMTDPTVSEPGMSIQCEACHGTGLQRVAPAAAFGDRHWNSGTQISNREGANTFASTLGHSQVCGQCHGSFINTPAEQGTNVQNNLGVYGYTPNLPFRLFGDINGAPINKSGVQTSASYTYIPTAEEFLANPTWYWMFPNGSNAKGNHYYYNEWAATGHSWRGALTTTDPDATAFQQKGTAHYSSLSENNITSKCYRCHTGEGYLESKKVIGAQSESGFFDDFTPTASNTGFMGQECTTCHGGHPGSLDEADVVREPDKAGQRSAVGLAVDNESICEDCHNWQMEVQGLTPNVRPIASLTSRGGASHPQRETLHGRIMVEIPAADGDFMPGAKCEDCHMPKTNKNANRFSHGMKPMLPGEAEEWMTAAGPSYIGEDSCSKCHGGQTRNQLQERIDDWQAETTAAADAAAAAITAAQTRSEFSLTDASNAGYILSGKATWNYKAWVNDGSTGVHNPEYIIAGLEKAEQLAKSVGGSIALDGPPSVLPGVSTFVSGKAVNGDGSPAAGATIKLWADGAVYGNGNGGSATVTAAANGTFAFMVQQADATEYTAQWVRSSDARTNLTSVPVTVNKAKYASTTTIKRSASSIKLNKSVTISGTVTSSAAVSGTVKLQYRKGSGTWKSTTLTLSATGSYKKKFTPASKGTWSYKATYSGTVEIATSKSGTVKVTVK